MAEEENHQPLALNNGSGGGIGGMVLAGAGIGLGFSIVGLVFSDRRLKTNVKRHSYSPTGVPIYSFKYTNDRTGGLYEGTIAQDILRSHPSAVRETPSGYMAVDYSAIDVPFRRIA